MAEDGFEFDIQEAELVAALDTFVDFAQPFSNDASGESAESVVFEAQSRLRNQLGPNATGETEAGIEARVADDGNGYVVVAANDREPDLPWFIEKGTMKGLPRSHSEAPRPFLDVAAELEQGPHVRRLEQAMQDAIDERGLGE